MFKSIISYNLGIIVVRHELTVIIKSVIGERNRCMVAAIRLARTNARHTMNVMRNVSFAFPAAYAFYF